jgi:hypothetical protein
VAVIAIGGDALVALLGSGFEPHDDSLLPDIEVLSLIHISEAHETVYFLCTEGSSYISGTEIEINGAQHV